MKNETQLAIMLFEKVAKCEYEIREVEFELSDVSIPKDEMRLYLKETEKIENKYAEKLRALKKKFGIY